jgi:NB-ARC domain
MELGLNLARPDDRPPIPGADTRAPGEPPSMYAETAGEIAIGRFMLQVGEAGGAVLREARRAERAHVRPRPAPVMLRPRLLRGLIDRRTELAAALSALDAGLPVEVSGPPGVGKTALLRHLAHHPRGASFVDGIVYLSARRRTSLDLLQRLFEAFYESETACKPTGTEIRRALQDKHALVLIDDVGLPQSEVEQVLDVAPHSAFVVGTRERCLWGEVRSIALTGLAAEDGALLLERELERSLDAAERSAAGALCAALEGCPRRIQQAAADIRRNGVPAGDWSRYGTPDGLVAELMTSIDEKERRVLLALSALSGVSIDARHVSGLAETPDVESALTGLVARGLVLNIQSRYRLADGVGDRLRRIGDPSPSVHRAITYFTAWAERQRRNRENLLEAADALLRIQQHATDTRRWGEALRLGRLLESAFVVSARWGAWELVLEQCLGAARALGDRAVEAWALHEMGTRAVCLGDEGNARRLLTQSATLREALGEHAAAAISRRNLGCVPAAVADEPRDSAAPAAAEAPEFDLLPLHREAVLSRHRPKTVGAGALLVTFLTCAILGGLTYGAVFGGLSWRPWERSSPVSTPSPAPQPQSAVAASPPLPLRDMTDVVPSGAQQQLPPPTAQRANILIFTARPGSIATSRPTNLCYAVSDAARARIEPGVGEVDPATTLTCRRVAPVRTTTYELSATGRDGVPVTQHVVIVVR